MRYLRWGVLLVVVLGLLGAAYYAYTYSQEQAAEDAHYAETLALLSRELSDLHQARDRTARDTERFKAMQCKEEWALTPDSTPQRLRRVGSMLAASPSFIERLVLDESPRAIVVKAQLIMRTSARGHPLLSGLDPEALLRQAEAKGDGHAQFYFLRLLAAKPLDTTEQGAADRYHDLNASLEKAANAGSGGAAYLLGSRLKPEALALFQETRRPFHSSRTPDEWLCRAAQLYHAGGALACHLSATRPNIESQKLLVQAAEAGHEEAALLLARNFHYGLAGYAVDRDEARSLYCRALYFGLSSAYLGLQQLEDEDRREAKRKLAAIKEERAKKAKGKGKDKAKSGVAAPKSKLKSKVKATKTAH